MTGFRLDKGGLIERRQKINFHFTGLQVTGFKGDTIASALMASGHMLVGRSFKYHRPRGIMSAGVTQTTGVITAINFVGTGNTVKYNASSATIDIAISGGGAVGTGTDQIFYESDQTVTQSYSISAGKNAMAAGPLAVASGQTITIPSGSELTIV